MKVSIVASDLADNSTGRADLLARLLSPRYEVDVVGLQFGERLWAPAQNGPIAYRGVRGARWPGFATCVPRLVQSIDGSLIIASKPRPTSFGMALLARAMRRRPLLLDVDDWELGFLYRGGRWGTVGRALNIADPNGLTATWLMERMVRRADALTVASRFLGERFGGTLLPHVRDTEAWRPERWSAAEARTRLGVGDRQVVMFLGTPREHKGIEDLVEAVGRLGTGVVLVIIGTDPTRPRVRQWGMLPHVRCFGKVPFDEVPAFLVGADVVAIPQRATTDTLGQVPAKLFDAMALGRPIVSTRVSMIPEILDGCGVVVAPDEPEDLAAGLRRLLANPGEAAALGRRARARCEARYSFAAGRSVLYPIVERLTRACGCS